MSKLSDQAAADQAEASRRNLGTANADVRRQLDLLHEGLRRAESRETITPAMEQVSDELEQSVEIERRQLAYDALGAIAVVQANIANAERDLRAWVQMARDNGATWTQIGQAAGISQQSAYNRWAEGAQAKRSDRQRQRRLEQA